MFNDTITLFNFYNGVWYRHIIPRVDIGAVDASSKTVSAGDTRSSSVTLLINTQFDKSIQTEGGVRIYLAPKEYARLADPILSQAITFDDKHDFIVLGAVYGDDPVNDDDYESGFYDHVYSRYDNVYRIVSAAWYGLIPHYEIGAR